VGNPKTVLKGGYLGGKGGSSFASLWFGRWLVWACKCAYDCGLTFNPDETVYEKSIAYLCFKNFNYGLDKRIKKKELVKSCNVPYYLHHFDVANYIFIYE